MAEKMNDTDKVFYKDGYRLALSIYDNGFSKEKMFETIKELYIQIDELLESFLQYSKTQGVEIDCFKGCDWCCLQTVFAVSHEFEYLHHYLKETFPKDKLDKVVEKAKLKNNILKNLPHEEQIEFRAPCALLHNGVCTAYEARPMGCRIYLSTRVVSCMENYKHPADKKKFPELLEFPLRAGRMLNEGFVAGLKANGYKSGEFRIEEGLVALGGFVLS